MPSFLGIRWGSSSEKAGSNPPKENPSDTGEPLPGPRRVVVFGTTGVGKSSVINMIENDPKFTEAPAIVASKASGVTDAAKEFHKHIDSNQYIFHDTPGTGEGNTGTVTTDKAVEIFYNLLTDHPVNLVVFVMRSGRMTAMEENNYRLINLICGKDIPTVLVVTHVEDDDDLETWWNRQAIKTKFPFEGHACIVALPRHTKYASSQTRLRDLVQEWASETGIQIETKDWFGRLLDSLAKVVKRRGTKDPESFHAEIAKVLKNFDIEERKIQKLLRKLGGMKGYRKHVHQKPQALNEGQGTTQKGGTTA